MRGWTLSTLSSYRTGESTFIECVFTEYIEVSLGEGAVDCMFCRQLLCGAIFKSIHKEADCDADKDTISSNRKLTASYFILG